MPRLLCVGPELICQQCWSARHGGVTRNMSHYAYDFEESLRPMIFGGAIPIRQRCGATQRAGQKSSKEILSLASYYRTLFYHF
jgi:hypothetical protein